MNKIILVDGWYTDVNNNKWNSIYYTEDKAVKNSLSLSNCSNCSNCSDCSNCSNCSDCSNCRNCSYCSNCINCSNSINCRNCRNCSYCSNCSNSINCINCSNCSDCSDCSDCSNSINCRNCRNCSYCSNCSNSINCSNCSNFKSNPQRIVSSNIGSRNKQTTVYWNEEITCVVCGCFRGTIEEFEEKIKETHKNNEHTLAYTKWLEKVKVYMS